ncbi:EEF1A lysine methyltransferase 2 isoform X2 [Eublepharis macularius]|uniref:EEF1A lysine methyltransferase 2 n=1 Tax=Eublepharis macularius TaxID=481883 RepID=A0AA97L2M0_EUBMA|nr:EEF1A lysine methyltransferase 2 isoform X2 [Eublepharis macularius]
MGGREEDFKPSALGTREHWDAAYECELKNFEDSGDTGEIWFGEESMSRLIGWLENQKIPLNSCVLDIGTGNGVLLVELVEDILNPSDELSGFHVCIDKGTFDAISLNPDNAGSKRKQYVKSLHRILRPGGLFLITSCNWTKEELLNEFGEGFILLEELPTSTFCFGGRTGNNVTVLVFQQKI